MTAAIVVALFAAIAVHLSRSREELDSVRRLSLQELVVACALQLAAQICLNGSLLLPLKACVSGLGFWELYLVRTGGFFVGSIIPVAGGLGVRLAYLRRQGLTYLDFTWATLLSNVLALAAAALLAAAATGVLWMIAGPPPVLVLAVSAGVLAMSVAAVVVFELLPRVTRHPRLRKWRWLSDMNTLNASPRMAAAVFALSLVRHTLNFATFGLLCQSLSGRPGDFLDGGLMYALTTPLRMVNITPQNLGIIEWFVALVGQALEFDLTIGLIVALAFRGIGLVAQLVGAGFGSLWIARWNRS